MLKNTVKSIAIIVAAAGLSVAVSMLGVGNESIIMVFLLGVLVSAVLTSSRAWATGVAFISVILFNYLFTEPKYTFQIYSSSDLMLLVFFLVTAVISGSITSRLKAEMALTSLNESRARTFYKIATAFLSESGKDNITALASSLAFEHTGLKADVVIFSPNTDNIGVDNGYSIESSTEKIGQLVFRDGKPDEQQLLIVQAICTQLGIALERERLVSEREEIKLAIERERQRTMLLRSVAHDLRSPLTALNGAGGLLADDYDSLTDTERRKLASDVSEEIVWLSDLVENILNMTRISENQLLLKKDVEVIDDIIGESVKHTERLLRGHRISVSLPDDVITATMDAKLITQVIINLLENAARHTTQGSKISLSVKTKDNKIIISVADTGEGVPDNMKDRIFERFVTKDGVTADGKRGLGLGLAICKTIVEAHGGNIWQEDNKPHGSVFTFTLPMEEQE